MCVCSLLFIRSINFCCKDFKFDFCSSCLCRCSDSLIFSCNFSLIARSRVPTSVAGSRRAAHSSLCSLQVVVVLAAFFGLEPSSCNLFAFSSLRLAFAAVVNGRPIVRSQKLATHCTFSHAILAFNQGQACVSLPLAVKSCSFEI